MCESFEAGFSYFLGVSLLSPKGNVTEEHFHHVGIVVKNISEAIDRCARALGIDKDNTCRSDELHDGKG